MSKFQKILLGAFCGGVLLCGLGAGIAFTEFTALEYDGEKILGAEQMVTDVVDVSFTPGETPYDIYSYYYSEYPEIVVDDTVPEGTVRFDVTYNAARVEPHPHVDEENCMISLDWYWEDVSEMELLMEAKEQILAELKEGKISAYDVEGVKEVRIRVNPVNEEEVRLIW